MIIPVILFIASAAFSNPTTLTASEYVGEVTAPETIQAYVEEYFEDIPTMVDIAWCESTMRHFNEDGEILRGMVDSDDIGIMQINTRYHQETADALAIDIYSLKGNLEYARYLYNRDGLQPWSASMPCWGKVAQN